MRQFKICLLLVVIPLFSRAQKDVGGFLQLSFGTSVPFGDYSAINSTESASGYAKDGYCGYAIFGHKVHKKLGAFGMLTGNVNYLDKGEYAKDLNTNQNTHEWALGGKPFWSVWGFTFGPYLSFPFNKWAFDMRLMSGAVHFNSPQIKAGGSAVSPAFGAGNIKRSAAEATSLAYGGGATVKYEFTTYWVFIANADFLAGNPRFTNVEHTVELRPGEEVKELESYSQKFTMFLFTVGVGYVF